MHTCRVEPLTLGIPRGIPGDDAVVCDVIDDVIRLTETVVSEALNARGQTRSLGLRCDGMAGRSAFKPKLHYADFTLTSATNR